MPRTLPALVLAMILPTVILATAARADAIRLRASVRLPDDATTILLAHVADLEGEEAQRWSDLVIAEPEASTPLVEIPIADVRARLDAAGVHWGRVNLSGRTVLVRRRTPGTLGAPLAMQGAALGDDDRPREPAAMSDEHVAADVIAERTLRGALAREMVRGLGVDAADLRLTFDRIDRDALDVSDTTMQFEIRPESGLRSDRVALAVRLWSERGVERSERIELRPVLRVPVAVLSRDVARAEEIAEGDFEVERRWLVPSQAGQCCTPVDAPGRLTTRRLTAGDTLDTKQVRRRTLVERGDRVVVRCLVGGIAISTQAVAGADGAAGDVIELRKPGERTTFLATISGRGEAVLDLSR